MSKFENAAALLIGVGAYTHSRFASLPATVRDAQAIAAVRDAQAIAAVLTDPAHCGYPPANVQTITGPARLGWPGCQRVAGTTGRGTCTIEMDKNVGVLKGRTQ